MSFEQFVSICVQNFIASYMGDTLSFCDNEERKKTYIKHK